MLALMRSEARWRQALGTASQERLRLRAEIGALRGTAGRDPSLAAPAAKRQKVSGGGAYGTHGAHGAYGADDGDEVVEEEVVVEGETKHDPLYDTVIT